MRNKKNVIIFILILSPILGISFLLQGRYREDSRPTNVMIIVIDALRPDHLSCYGYERNTSPNIDRLAKEGIRFTQVIAAGGWTVESVPSILTGTYSLNHRVRNFDTLRNHQISTLAGELAKIGYRCVLWSNLLSLEHLDIKDGFQRIYILGGIIERNYKPALTEYVLTSQIINRLRAQYKNRPFFFYIHYHGPHPPYRPPAPYKYMYLNDNYRKRPEFVPLSTLSYGQDKYSGDGKIPYVVAEENITDQNYYISQYDGAISYTDTQIGRLMDSIKKLGLDRNTLIVLTSDHGEFLGEHNIYFNHAGCYEENIKVPLIIRYPKLFPKGKVISKQVSLIDVAPTVLKVVGLDKPSYIQEESLLAFIKPWRIYRTKYSFSSYSYKCSGKCFALRTASWKLIYNAERGSYELYNLKKDPKEQHNLTSQRVSKFRQLKSELENFMKRVSTSTPVKKGLPLTEEEKERLRSLGYIQ